MEVILMEKLPNLGALGDVVKVKQGYARNYLIPHGKAKRATADNIAAFELRRAELEKTQADGLSKAQLRAEKLDGASVQITRKAGADGRLFGSVTNADIAEALSVQGFDIAKAEIRMPAGPLKLVGDFPLSLALHPDVVTTITVSVLGEQ
jgi:large subunit ribosomal protein L9